MPSAADSAASPSPAPEPAALVPPALPSRASEVDAEPSVPASAMLTASELQRLLGPLPLDRVLNDAPDPAGPKARRAAVRRGVSVVTASALPRGRRSRLVGSWSLLGLEQLLWQAEPAIVGAAVTRIAGGDWWAAGLIAAVVGSAGAVAVGRTKYDTRTFSRLHARLASGVLARQRGAPADGAAAAAGDAGPADPHGAVSRIAARVNLAENVTEFLETDLPEAVNGAACVIGGTIMLGWYDARLIPLCLILGAAGVAWNLHLGRQTGELSRRMNDQAEREIAAISAGTPEAASEHFGRIAVWRGRIGSIEATALGGTRAVQFVLLIAALLLCAGGIGGGAGTTLAVGTIYAVVRYVQKFGEGMAELPSLMRRYVLLRDVLRRLGE